MGLATEMQGCKKVSRDDQHATPDNTVIFTDLRIEFCKTKARAGRWREEVELLREEMERVKRFFKTRSSQWLSLAPGNFDVFPVDQATIEGQRAYALEQSAQFERMYAHCVKTFNKYA